MITLFKLMMFIASLRINVLLTYKLIYQPYKISFFKSILLHRPQPKTMLSTWYTIPTEEAHKFSINIHTQKIEIVFQL